MLMKRIPLCTTTQGAVTTGAAEETGRDCAFSKRTFAFTAARTGGRTDILNSTGLEKRSLTFLIVCNVRSNDDLSESNTPSKTADGSSNTAVVFDGEIKNTGKKLSLLSLRS
ncbi:uncharacterized protein BO87DRAFT_429819 [Aspergillus neoniger CBS 115656]|uniref:Uncharacterized protein n=1 Tax=Aspergillus neoniger (strain CBS 115656) TaxID=1448310 RepID=A0A318YPN8_ASPNB|nr:hypothetical protein BO87DRAFT_429819 [Aspergillus neoniger CBS 115656]PYH30148.1 hypothetical protein BO87DRAFT_429819 [Aspergillus neoniger CBS 115656]